MPPPPVASGAPEMPRFLNEVAQEEWERIVPILLSQNVLTVADGPALGLYCSAFSRLVQANRELEHTVTATTAAGNEKTNPAVNVAKEAEASMLRVLTHFLQTPLSRSKGGIAPHEDDDQLTQFLLRAQARRSELVDC